MHTPLPLVINFQINSAAILSLADMSTTLSVAIKILCDILCDALTRAVLYTTGPAMKKKPPPATVRVFLGLTQLYFLRGETST